MVLKATVSKGQLARARSTLRGHPFNDPKDVAMQAAKLAMPKIARKVKANTPKLTGALRRSIKPVVVQRKSGALVVGVSLESYGIFVNHRTKNVTRHMKPKDVVQKIAEEVKNV